ncbi:MAG: hypothetical protein GX804_10080 [Lentisphaerae bacterium]|nr:hypothetical protein [Lentisphaerota bacterium]
MVSEPGSPERLLGFCLRDDAIVLVLVPVLVHDFMAVNIQLLPIKFHFNARVRETCTAPL